MLWTGESQTLASSAPPALADAQPPTIPRSDVSPIIQPKSLPAQVPTVPSPNITPPNPQASSLIPQTTHGLSFAPNSTQTTMNSNFNTNPQKSLTELMSEETYNWPNQIQQDQDLFFFPGFQDLSRGNDLNNNANFFSQNVVLQGLQIISHIRSSPLSTHTRTATISIATLQQISTRHSMSLEQLLLPTLSHTWTVTISTATLQQMPTRCSISMSLEQLLSPTLTLRKILTPFLILTLTHLKMPTIPVSMRKPKSQESASQMTLMSYSLKEAVVFAKRRVVLMKIYLYLQREARKRGLAGDLCKYLQYSL